MHAAGPQCTATRLLRWIDSQIGIDTDTALVSDCSTSLQPAARAVCTMHAHARKTPIQPRCTQSKAIKKRSDSPPPRQLAPHTTTIKLLAFLPTMRHAALLGVGFALCLLRAQAQPYDYPTAKPSTTWANTDAALPPRRLHRRLRGARRCCASTRRASALLRLRLLLHQPPRRGAVRRLPPRRRRRVLQQRRRDHRGHHRHPAGGVVVTAPPPSGTAPPRSSRRTATWS